MKHGGSQPCSKSAEALKKFDEAASAAANRVNDPANLDRVLSPETPAVEISRQLAAVLLDPNEVFGGSMVYVWGEGATAAKAQLTDFAFALAEYHNDHSAYPRSLAELSPQFMAQVPKGAWADRDYIYRPRDNGYLLYSVGRNGKDDGGESSLDNPKKYRRRDQHRQASRRHCHPHARGGAVSGLDFRS